VQQLYLSRNKKLDKKEQNLSDLEQIINPRQTNWNNILVLIHEKQKCEVEENMKK
jgi:hypothetical protein